MRIRHLIAASSALLLAAGAALAADDTKNLEKLSKFQLTGTSMDIPTVQQGGKKAENIRAFLRHVKLPQGFKIDLFAIVPDARHMAIGNNVGTVFVGTRKSKVYAATDRDMDREADEVKEFAPSLRMNVPNGPCMSPDGFLFIAEHNRVLVYPAAEFFYETPDVAAFVVVDQGQLVPTEEESFNHGARVCAIGPDNKLYISLGQPHNVTPTDKVESYRKLGIGGIIRMERDGTKREVIATGVRNSVGIAFNPANGQLWFTDNQVDGMGDDIPPGEINRVTAAGQHFGFPWYGGGKTRTTEFQNSEPPANAVFPEVEMDAHAADLGLTFYSGRTFPSKYRGGIFSAQHGSWNRTTPVGARVMFTPLKEDGSAGKTEVFASGWLDEATGEYRGRPVDVKTYLDGSLLVSDDKAGAIYRISYSN